MTPLLKKRNLSKKEVVMTEEAKGNKEVVSNSQRDLFKLKKVAGLRNHMARGNKTREDAEVKKEVTIENSKSEEREMTLQNLGKVRKLSPE